MKIGSAQGFWGDSPGAAARLVAAQSDLDYLILEYLAEVSMSIMAIQREKDGEGGYAKDLIEVVKNLAPYWKEGQTFRLITNAGGLDPHLCGQACKRALEEVGLQKKIGVVTGDDVYLQIKTGDGFENFETGESLDGVRETLVTANAYTGAGGIVQALEMGADIVITGRAADPSLVVGPAIYHYGWSFDEYDKIAGATVAGHLIECGTQVTGGIATHWLDLNGVEDIGFPVAEISEDGSCVITKPLGTGGEVSIRTVKEQLLYEIEDPDNYYSPDVIVSFLSLLVEQYGKDRVGITGARGKPPTDYYKVSATYDAGYKSEAMLVMVGNALEKKARRSGDALFRRLKLQGYPLKRFSVECIGSGDATRGVLRQPVGFECVLRLACADSSLNAVTAFSKEVASLVTSGAQGITGYTTGRPKVRRLFGFWPCLIHKRKIDTKVELL